MGPHGLEVKAPAECQVGGLRDGKASFGMYNQQWSKRLVKQ